MTGHQQEDPSNGKADGPEAKANTLTAPPSEVTIGPAQDTDLPSVFRGHHRLRPALP